MVYGFPRRGAIDEQEVSVAGFGRTLVVTWNGNIKFGDILLQQCCKRCGAIVLSKYRLGKIGGQMNRIDLLWQMEEEFFVEGIIKRGYDGTFQTTAFKPWARLYHWPRHGP